MGKSELVSDDSVMFEMGMPIVFEGIKYGKWRRLWRRFRYFNRPWMEWDDWEPLRVLTVTKIDRNTGTMEVQG